MRSKCLARVGSLTLGQVKTLFLIRHGEAAACTESRGHMLSMSRVRLAEGKFQRREISVNATIELPTKDRLGQDVTSHESLQCLENKEILG